MCRGEGREGARVKVQSHSTMRSRSFRLARRAGLKITTSRVKLKASTAAKIAILRRMAKAEDQVARTHTRAERTRRSCQSDEEYCARERRGLLERSALDANYPRLIMTSELQSVQPCFFMMAGFWVDQSRR